MKKKMWLIPVIAIAVLALVLFLPIPQSSYDDGGTREYTALAYKIVAWNKLVTEVDENGQLIDSTYRDTSVYWFPDSQKSIDDLWEMEMEKVDRTTPTPSSPASSVHLTITSGDTTIRPYSRMTWSRIDNGDGTYEEVIADHCDPVTLVTDQADHIPTLTVKDDASYSTSANGRVEAVYLYSPVGDTYVSKATAWETLADLSGGTYYVMLAVLLGGNCNPDAPQNFYRYEDFFRLVVDKPNRQNGVVYPTVQLHPLYKKYPEYFGLDGMKGVEVYVWQMAGNLYYCGALSGTNRLKTEEEIQGLFGNGATMEEMRTILELCEIERERVSIIPVQNPLSSYWYEIDIEYAKQINALFWGE